MKETAIEIGGKRYPCYMTMGAIVYFKRLAGKDISRMDPTDVEESLMVLYCVVKAASKAEGVPFDTDFPTFEDFAVAVTPQQMEDFQALQAAEQAADDSKKKRAAKR
jgi:hypothetical protein